LQNGTAVSYKYKHLLIIQPGILFLDIYPKEIKNIKPMPISILIWA
jgi:hypothetical protein